MATNHDAFPHFDQSDVAPDENPEKSASLLMEAHERFGIDLNAPEIIYRTIERNGFIHLEFEEPDNLPTPEQWIAQRMAQGYSGYNYGCFVMTDGEQGGFAKVHYGPENVQSRKNDDGEVIEFEVGGLDREMQVLEALDASGYDVPAVLASNFESPEGTAPEEKVYGMLIIEAYLPESGKVRARNKWTPELSRVASRKIKTFARPVSEVPLFKNESIPLPVEGLLEVMPRGDVEYEEKLAEVLSSYRHLDEPIVVHGDTWFNNIIARHDDSDVLFVDWELAGPGYQGQDAGRKLWDLTLISEDDWGFSEYTEAAAAFTDEWSETDDDRKNLEFGVMYESLRWIAERVRDMAKEGISEEDREIIEQEIPQIKAHAIKILAHIGQEQQQ